VTVRTKHSRIYLDHQATTPVDPRVIQAMQPYLADCFANPSATTHVSGIKARQAVENARKQIALAIGAPTNDIIFTSGATESNNLAILGTIEANKSKRNRVITVSTEHKSVLETTKQLRSRGYEVISVGVGKDGIVNVNELRKYIDSNTLLVSVMLVNNETGVIQPIKEISEICNNDGALLHSDCAQALGKMPVNVISLDVNLASFSAHKVYGPKGIGALYIKQLKSALIRPITFGGGQERGLRPGTLPVNLCVGFGEAAKISLLERNQDSEKSILLEQRLWNGILSVIPQVKLNGHPNFRAPGCMNIACKGISSDSLIDAWAELEIAKGSACEATNTQSSHVLRAMGLSRSQADSSLRIGVGRFTNDKEISRAISIIQSSFGFEGRKSGLV